jgi:hypothetical protein
VYKPEQPQIGRTEPTKPIKADLTVFDVIEIADLLTARKRKSRLRGLGGLMRLRAVGSITRHGEDD